METAHALVMFDALSQETRLRAFRLLVEAGPDGLPAGAISDQLGIAHNTLSFHLSHLSHAGLINSRKSGRSVIYAACFEQMQALIAFMVKDCCSRDVAHIREDNDSGCAVIEF